jgi:hypothetical protein
MFRSMGGLTTLAFSWTCLSHREYCSDRPRHCRGRREAHTPIPTSNSPEFPKRIGKECV